MIAAAPVAWAAPPTVDPGAPGAGQAAPPGPSTWVRPAHGCGTEQLDRTGSIGPAPVSLAAAAQRTIYLNRSGGTYTIGGATNSATNTASPSVSQNGATAVIPPLGAGFNWPAIAACVKAHYAPYNIRVVETEPTSGIYIEAVVGGFGTELGFPADQLFGIASADNFCGVTEAGIAFSFSETHRQVPRKDDELCATIAHEVGHLLALEHETLAIDLMSYVLISESSTKTFANQSVPCGTQPGQNQGCFCGGSTTNSGGRLTSFVGLRPIETEPPVLTVVSPGNDSSLTPTFEVIARATDNMAMEGVTAYLNGLAVGTDFEPDGDEYRITVAGAAEGAYTLAIEAVDQAGNDARAELAVTIAKLAIGETCAAATDCAGEVCASSSTGMFCTEVCDPAADACPDGFACNEAAAVCAPSDDGSCCSTGQSPTGATGLMIFAVGLMLVRRRRAAR